MGQRLFRPLYRVTLMVTMDDRAREYKNAGRIALLLQYSKKLPTGEPADTYQINDTPHQQVMSSYV